MLVADPRALRAYAHPVRRRALALLRTHGTLTATQAADALGESSGTMSFHLRQLAKYGLVEEAPTGKGRQKPWRATSLTTQVPSYSDDPETAEAARDLKMSMTQLYLEQVLTWLQASHEFPPEWQEAADFGDNVLYLTADELTVSARTSRCCSRRTPVGTATRRSGPPTRGRSASCASPSPPRTRSIGLVGSRASLCEPRLGRLLS